MSVIAKPFAFHKPSPDSLDRINAIRAAFTKVQDVILEKAPASRERSVAITELETAAMWAIKSVVSNDPASVAQLDTSPTAETDPARQ